MCIDNGGTRAKLHRLLSKGEISKDKTLNREDIFGYSMMNRFTEQFFFY